MGSVSNLFGSTTPAAGAFPIAGASGRIDPLWLSASDVLDQLSTATGSLAVRTAAGWRALQPSTTGLVLTSQGIGAVPIWAASAGSAGGGGTPAGSSTWIQYNNGGAFGAIATLAFDGTQLYVGVRDSGPLFGGLGIYGTSDATAGMGVRRYSADANSSALYLTKSRGTSTSPAYVNTNDNLGTVSGGSWQGTSGVQVWNSTAVGMYFRAAQNWAAGANNGTELVLFTTPNASASTKEWAKLTNGGSFYLNSSGSTYPTVLPRLGLAVFGTTYDSASVGVRAYNTDGTTAKLNLGTANGTVGAPGALTSSFNLGAIGFGGYDGTSTWVENACYINVQATETWSSTAHGCSMRIRTTANLSTALADAIFINQTSFVILGSTTDDGVNRLQVNGSIKSAGAITTGAPITGTAAAWKHGIYVTTAPAATGYVQLDIGGVLYKLLAST